MNTSAKQMFMIKSAVATSLSKSDSKRSLEPKISKRCVEPCHLTAMFEYDALGRRIEKTINGRTIQYLYDGLDIVQEIESGFPSVNYMRTMSIDEPLARIEASGTVRYYQADALRSVISLTDQTGALKSQYTYDPFGNVIITGAQSDNPFQYTGRENDNTGLYYYRARYYTPELQRFISEDPIGFHGGDVNFYAYVGNDPANYTDPNGLRRPRPQPSSPPPILVPKDPANPDNRAPGAGNPPPRSEACIQTMEQYCDLISCPWGRVEGACYVKNLDNCQCLHWSYRPIVKCGDRVYR